MNSVFRDRTAKSLLMAAALIALVGTVRDREDVGLHPDTFWGLKLGWYHNSDMVIAGDSAKKAARQARKAAKEKGK